MNNSKKVIIFGTSGIAEIANEYLTHDSDYEVACFTVEKDYINSNTFQNRPLIPFEDIEIKFPPEKFKMFIALGYKELNQLRARIYKDAEKRGYELISYISSKAFVWKNVEIGKNCFIFEDNTVQPYVKIGDNVTLWSGNHIGHHSIIRDNCFVSSHVVVSGYCEIKENCFLGVNSTIGHRTIIEKDCLVGMGAVVTKKTSTGRVYVGNPAKDLKKNSKDLL